MRRLVQLVTGLFFGDERVEWDHDVEPRDVMPLDDFLYEARRRKASSVTINVTRRPSSSEGYIVGTPYDFLAQYRAFGFNGALKITREPGFVDRILYTNEELTRTVPASVSEGSPIVRLAIYLEIAAVYCAQQGFQTIYTNPFPSVEGDPYIHDLEHPVTRKVTLFEASQREPVSVDDLLLF